MARYDLNFLARKIAAIIVNKEIRNITAYDIAIFAGTGLNYAYLIRRVLENNQIIDQNGNVNLQAARQFLEVS